MGKIYIKTIHGRKYRYERISTKRSGGKVVTKEVYLGPVAPARAGRKSKMAEVPESIREEVRTRYSVGDSVASMVEHLKNRGYGIGERALRNWLKTQEKRSDIEGMREFMGAEGGTAAARRRGWATRRRKAGEVKARAKSAQEIERERREEVEDVMKAQLKREAEEAARWRQEAGEWQQRFRQIKG